MPQVDPALTTGIRGFDDILTGLIPGDNLVWQVDSIEDYRPFATPYTEAALAKSGRLIYFRFAKHGPLVPEGTAARTYRLRPEAGFEAFVSDIHKAIEREGQGGYYVFDCLSDLAADWYSDQMLGNFFMLTCPYIYDVGGIAYFGLLRGHHSPEANAAVADTAQVVLDVYRHDETLYVHPLKVQQRYSPTMYMLHVRRGEDMQPVVESATISEIMNSVPWAGLEGTSRRVGVVNRAFSEAEATLDGSGPAAAGPASEELLRRLLRIVVTRDDRVHDLAGRYLTLSDAVAIKQRMIGTGLIGGKSVGMLLARAILKKTDPSWKKRLEPHDSFYVGSDVYYTFVVRNGLWWVRERQKDPATFLDGAERARQRMLVGTFPDYVIRQFATMLDYYGQSPIIVRSSSLLEDNFGNAFAGKYESVFCANQGPRHKRLEEFLAAVRTIYASTMSENALRYRAQRGLLERDEQMALLVQRVSGGMYGEFFYPQVAGVGLSYNPYVWSSYIKPESGVLRIVFGLGTRAVNRFDDDYTRIVALNAPGRRPEASAGDVRRYSQRKVDVLDMRVNSLRTSEFPSVAGAAPGLPLDVLASRDPELEAAVSGSGDEVFPWILTFDKLLKDTDFASDMRDMLRVIQDAYEYPVDTEFTANFRADGSYRINLVQCRPLQVKGGGVVSDPPEVREEDVVFRARGAVIGQSRLETIDRIIYVVPRTYSSLPLQRRYSVARLIGRLLHPERGPASGSAARVMLMGPGRWGTTTPSLGVPVNFTEVNTVTALCEIVAMRDDLVPDVSLGTHFFNELVEMDVLYLALFPGKEGNVLNEALLEGAPNRLTDLLPDDSAYSDVVRVIDIGDLPGNSTVKLHANAVAQTAMAYVRGASGTPTGDR
jgi:hypothetical protein